MTQPAFPDDDPQGRPGSAPRADVHPDTPAPEDLDPETLVDEHDLDLEAPLADRLHPEDLA